MTDIETELRKLIRAIVIEVLDGKAPAETPELISIQEAAKICDCTRAAIDALIADAPANGFPAIKLSRKMVKIDKQRLINWLREGGLNRSSES